MAAAEVEGRQRRLCRCWPSTHQPAPGLKGKEGRVLTAGSRLSVNRAS